MKTILRNFIDRIEGIIFRYFPVSVGLTWLRLVRSNYAAYNSEAYYRAVSLLKMNKLTGDIAEFGVGSGATSILLYCHLRTLKYKEPYRFFLFDSFEGLPPVEGSDKHEQWNKGDWSYDENFVRARLRRYNADLNTFRLVKGFYHETLNSDTSDNLKLDKLALVHIDCDLKSSTDQVLMFIKPYIQQGMILLFDDYYCYSGDLSLGEAGSLREWCKDENISAHPWFSYSFHGQAFILSVK